MDNNFTNIMDKAELEYDSLNPIARFAADTVAGFNPITNTVVGVKDFKDAYNNNDNLGMGLAALGTLAGFAGLGGIKSLAKVGKIGSKALKIERFTSASVKAGTKFTSENVGKIIKSVAKRDGQVGAIIKEGIKDIAADNSIMKVIAESSKDSLVMKRFKKILLGSKSSTAGASDAEGMFEGFIKYFNKDKKNALKYILKGDEGALQKLVDANGYIYSGFLDVDRFTHGAKDFVELYARTNLKSPMDLYLGIESKQKLPVGMKSSVESLEDAKSDILHGPKRKEYYRDKYGLKETTVLESTGRRPTKSMLEGKVVFTKGLTKSIHVGPNKAVDTGGINANYILGKNGSLYVLDSDVWKFRKVDYLSRYFTHEVVSDVKKLIPKKLLEKCPSQEKVIEKLSDLIQSGELDKYSPEIDGVLSKIPGGPTLKLLKYSMNALDFVEEGSKPLLVRGSSRLASFKDITSLFSDPSLIKTTKKGVRFTDEGVELLKLITNERTLKQVPGLDAYAKAAYMSGLINRKEYIKLIGDYYPLKHLAQFATEIPEEYPQHIDSAKQLLHITSLNDIYDILKVNSIIPGVVNYSPKLIMKNYGKFRTGGLLSKRLIPKQLIYNI